MGLAQKNCVEFVEATFSKEPVPGGGSVAALTGALGASLGGMVCSLTAGRKNSADVSGIAEALKTACSQLLSLMDEDADNFLPLSKAYGMPKGTPEEAESRREVLQSALRTAAQAPEKIVRVGVGLAGGFEELLAKSTPLALSDAGCGAAILAGAVRAAWLNVLINLEMMDDVQYVERLRAELTEIIGPALARLDSVYERVAKTIAKEQA